MGGCLTTLRSHCCVSLLGVNDMKSDNKLALFFRKIGKRLKDFGVGGYLQHFVKKSARNYFDGCFGWGGLGETFYTEIFPERGTVLCSLIRSLYYDNTEDTLYRYQALFRQILWYMVLVLVPFSVFTKRPLDKKRQVAVLSVLGLMLYLQIFEAVSYTHLRAHET